MRRALSALPVLAVLAGLPLLLAAPRAHADPGMWTFDNFPGDLLKRRYGADISRPWLDRVRSSVIRLSNCTASFVSPDGLILTNHHCSESCLDEHSTPEKNLLRTGFLARSRRDEQ
ncbi:MAG TPA: S46 family peptidase, partial [Steroidobacteraceae bacterium]|nr:S46 family peptidase [Steroidobacteraceae bacterium]